MPRPLYLSEKPARLKTTRSFDEGLRHMKRDMGKFGEGDEIGELGFFRDALPKGA